MAGNDVLFIPYTDTLDLLSVADAMRVCEDVFRMHARGTVQWSNPPNFKLDKGPPFHNRWHVKGVFLEEIPATGVRLYNYYDDGDYNNVGHLDCARYVLLADPRSGRALAIVDEHWSYAIRSAAAAVVPCKWLGPSNPKVLGLVGVGTMGVNALRCLATLYAFEEIKCTSRRAETREAFARDWSRELGVPVRALDSVEDVVRGSDIVVGGTTSTDIVAREPWVKPGCTFISMARRELDPAGWPEMDKVVVDSWEMNMRQPWFRDAEAAGQISRETILGEVADVITGRVPGRERDGERILILTDGLASQDVAIAHFLYEKARASGRGIWLPSAAGP